MVRKFNPKLNGYKISVGYISLTVEKLSAILRNHPSVTISHIRAISDGFLFDDLDDIEDNRSLFRGRPTIYIGFDEQSGFWIRFRRGVYLETSNLQNEDQLLAVEAICNELKTRRRILDFVRQVPTAVYSSLLLTLFLLIFLKEFSGLPTPFLQSTLDNSILALIGGFVILNSIEFVYLSLPYINSGVENTTIKVIKNSTISHTTTFIVGGLLALLVNMFLKV